MSGEAALGRSSLSRRSTSTTAIASDPDLYNGVGLDERIGLVVKLTGGMSPAFFCGFGVSGTVTDVRCNTLNDAEGSAASIKLSVASGLLLLVLKNLGGESSPEVLHK